MIRKTRIKIIIATMLILIAVFAAIGAITSVMMVNNPLRHPHEPPRYGAPHTPSDQEFEDAVREVETQLVKDWLTWYSVFAGTGLAGLFVIICVLSGWIVKPVKETIQKQKQFVSDASHELKTPISIISANADVLAACDTDNKWLHNIRTQTERMRLLTNDLLLLTRLDENLETLGGRVNLSEIITAAVLPFESVVFEAGKKLETNIAKNLYGAGRQEDIVKAVHILMDNAVKYSETGGKIKVSLVKQNGKTALEIFNTGVGVTDADKSKIFDRFYRSDYSRARETGGNGLGLSILKTLADQCNWKLSVSSDEKSYAAFTIYF